MSHAQNLENGIMGATMLLGSALISDLRAMRDAEDQRRVQGWLSSLGRQLTVERNHAQTLASQLAVARATSAALEEEVDDLEDEVEQLRAEVARLRRRS
ncbi:hypothetical protein [Azospirillum argentinense]|uniref:hypothetical protein n=1 Tax=Azospirillum argentinense TaxID=2970906 RepID=UPI0032DEACAB